MRRSFCEIRARISKKNVFVSGMCVFSGGFYLANKRKPNTSDCKARHGCGLCGCAARPTPHIVKHARASHKRALTELGEHTHTHTRATQKSANIHTTHKGKNNSIDEARAKRAPHRYCCWRARSARPLCVWCECCRSFVCAFLAL